LGAGDFTEKSVRALFFVTGRAAWSKGFYRYLIAGQRLSPGKFFRKDAFYT
jgi:hypothetical protein